MEATFFPGNPEMDSIADRLEIEVSRKITQEANNVEIFSPFFGVLPFQQECPDQSGTALFRAGPVATDFAV